MQPQASSSRLRLLALNGILLLAGILVALVLLEILLLVHNPFQARIKGNRIVLLTNKQYHIKNDVIPTLDPVVTVTRNSLGFRGPNPPPDLERYLSIISIGGSTTQCFFLSDDKTWTARLGQKLEPSFKPLWINNAGLDGHSTYGHLVLLEDHVRQVHPKVVVFLIGANDVARDPGVEWDAENVKGSISFHSPTAFLKSLSPYSEVASMIANLYRSANAYKQGLFHQKIDFKQQGYLDDVKTGDEQAYLNEVANPRFLQGFEDRVRRLITISRSSGIEPVLVTQPLLAGSGIDDVTGLDMGRIRIGPGHSGKMWWSALERYNDVTRHLGQENKVTVVDLAHNLPKTSRYFYDFIHFTNEGAEAVATIIARDLCPVMKQRFPAYATGSDCPN